MDQSAFRDLFQQDDAPAARAKFLSRLFGIFSETIVQIWSFAAFLAAARGEVPSARQWKVGSRQLTVDGAILVWGSVSAAGRAAVLSETGLHDVLGLDRIVSECAKWRPDAYCRLVSDRHRWCEQLFTFLDGRQ